MVRGDHGLIAVTAGDPSGIGPEVILKAIPALPAALRSRLVIIGDRIVFAAASKRLRLSLPARPPRFIDCGAASPFYPGRSSAAAGRAALGYLDRAVSLWRTGQIQALVTAPVTKWAIGKVAPSFVGQTEHLARAMGRRDALMMFVSDRLRVALLTRHIPLARVSSALNQPMLNRALKLIAAELTTQFDIRRPKLAICGLNPHAGEEARCGREERDIMMPALRSLRRQGIVCDGPFAADGFFAAGYRTYDAVVCAYHDQGLIPFKMLARDRGCQLSVGLPIPRTSPDHGSALDIAGRGIADPGSMIYAIRLAAKLACSRSAR